MMTIEKVLLPTDTGDTGGKLNYKDGKLVSYEHGSMVSVYLFHETDDDGAVRAMELKMGVPLTFEKCVNAAEMSAYGLRSAMDVASLASSLARKSRTGEDASEVAEHDTFISAVKTELAKLGFGGSYNALQVAIADKIAAIDAYDNSDAVNGFTVNGQHVWFDAATRSNYRGSISDAELLGETTISVPFGDSTVEMAISDAKLALARIQKYANECATVTAIHKKTVAAMTTAEEVAAYDHRQGYPEKLAFTL